MIVEDWARLSLCNTLSKLQEGDVLVYLSLPLCRYTVLEEEALMRFIKSIMLPHQVVIVASLNPLQSTVESSFRFEKGRLQQVTASECETFGSKPTDLNPFVAVEKPFVHTSDSPNDFPEEWQ